MALEENEIRRILAQCAGQEPPDPWVTGVTLVTASERIEGGVEAVDGDLAVITTVTGERRVPISEIVNVLLHMQSPGRE